MRIAAVIILAVVFQNCAQQKMSSGQHKLSGNGEGYGGKVRYENPVGNCTGVANPQAPVNAIERTGNAFVQVRKDCADITPPTPIPPGQVQWFPHNSTVAVYNGAVYKQEGTLPPLAGISQNVHRFCRSDGRDGAGTGEVADSLIIRGDNGAFTGNVILAAYAGNAQSGVLVNYNFTVTNTVAESYTGTNLPTGRLFQLDITLPGVTPLNFDLPGIAAPNVNRSVFVTCYEN